MAYLQDKPAKRLQDLHSGISPDLVDIVENCLKLDPSRRATANDLVLRPIFDEIRSGHETKVVAKPVKCKIDSLKVMEETGVVKDYPVDALRAFLVK